MSEQDRSVALSVLKQGGEIVTQPLPEAEVRVESDLAAADERLERVDNDLAAGLNRIVEEMLESVAQGHIYAVEQAAKRFQQGVDLARKHEMGMGMHEKARPFLEAALEARVPEALQSLVGKGGESVKYGFPGNVDFNRKQLANFLTMIEGGKVSFLGTDKKDGTALAPVKQEALVADHELLRAFDKRTAEAVPEGVAGCFRSIESTLRNGDVWHVRMLLKNLNDVEAVGDKFANPQDKDGNRARVKALLEKGASEALAKAVKEVANTVIYGNLDLVGYRKDQIADFLKLLEEWGVSVPKGAQEYNKEIDVVVREAMAKGVETLISGVIDAVKFGYPSNMETKIDSLGVLLDSMEASGQKVVSMDEIEKRIFAGVSAVFFEGIENIITGVSGKLRRGDFTAFNSQPVTDDAKARIDQMISLGQHVGVVVGDPQEFYNRIDRAVEEIRLVSPTTKTGLARRAS